MTEPTYHSTHPRGISDEEGAGRTREKSTRGLSSPRKQGVCLRMKCLRILVVVQSLSHVRLFETPWTAAHQASLSFSISWSFLKLISTESVMSSNHLVLCRPILLLPSIFPSTRVFSAALWSLQKSQLPRPPRFWRKPHPTPAQVLGRKASLQTKGISSLHLVSGKKKKNLTLLQRMKRLPPPSLSFPFNDGISIRETA